MGIFRAQNDRLVGDLMGTEFFSLRPNLCLWWLFKEGNHQALMDDFAWRPGVDFLDIFSAQNDHLVIGYLMDTEIV